MKTHAWQRSIASLIFLPMVTLAFFIDASSLIYSFALYMFFLICVTCGYHRLFTHSAYTTNRFWHWLFGIGGCMSLNSSPAQWSMIHSMHHKYSDTDKDPHDTTWRHYFRFKDRKDISPDKGSIRLLRDPMHQFFLNHSLSICLLYGAITLIFGLWAFLFFYVIPVTMYLFIAGLNVIYAHGDGAAKDRPLLEFILPQAGEWIHKEHHIHPKVTPLPGGPDLGGLVIELIRTDKK
jgi:stearoyl-CoA desaturase (delta-9 desaturase)